MTPLRLQLRGFKSYQREQIISFDEAPLLVIHGRNGAGKSSLFDAMLYALFNRKQAHFSDLINHGSDRLEVRFDFECGGVRYRVDRSLSRSGVSARQAFRHDGQDWQLEPDTDSNEGFGSWCARTLGMDEGAFCSCVLLEQGQADRLIESDPAERHRILSRLIGLDRFRGLHELIAAERRRIELRVEALLERLQEVGEVSEEELREREAAIGDRERETEALRKAERELQELLRHARTWEELVRKRDQLEQEMRRGDDLIIRREEIVRAHEELQALLPVREPLRRAVELSARIALMQRAVDELTEQQKQRAAEVMRKEAQQATIEQELQQRSAQVEGQREQVAALGERLLVLERLDGRGRQVAALQRREEQLLGALAELPAELDERRVALAAELGSLRAEQGHAQAQRQELQTERAMADRERKDAEAALLALREEALGPRCSRCGQQVGPEHLAMEEDRLGRHRDAARGRERELAAQCLALAATERERQQRIEQIDKEVQGLSLQQRDCDRYREELSRLGQERAEVVAGQAIEELLSAGERLRQLTEERDARKAELLAMSQVLQGQREAHGAIVKALPTLRRMVQLSDGERGQKMALIEGWQEQLAEAWAQLPPPWQAQAEVDGAQAVSAVSARIAELSHVPAQHEALQRALAGGLPDRLRELEAELARIGPEARRESGTLHRELEDRQATLAQRAEEIGHLRGELVRQRDDRERRVARKRDLDDAVREQAIYQHLDRLLGRDGLQRHLMQQAEEGIVEAANETLRGLSAGRLSLCLRSTVRPPQKGKPHREKDPVALDLLVCNLATSPTERPMPIKQCSGSQKFRIAISLALAVGRYLTRQARRVESIVIDEGFGSLDAPGRDEMIGVLRDLSQQLAKIVIVSHQDEFIQGGLPGYRVSLEDASTVVQPL